MILFNGVQYAENDREFTESLFTPGASYNLLHSIKKTSTSYLFFIDSERGVFGKFTTINKKRFFQHYLEKTPSEKENHKAATNKYLQKLN